MKKRSLIYLFLAFSLLFCSCGGGEIMKPTEEAATQPTESSAAPTADENDLSKRVNAPMKGFPDYSLPADATTDQIRAMAVQAMRDGLSVKWTPYREITYNKSGAVSHKDYINKPGTVYAGLPYTNGATGILTWLQYYDFETGILSGYDPAQVNENLGNSCAAAVAWGWHAVVPESFVEATFTFVVARGALRVGPYTYDDSITTFRNYSTENIVNDNGVETMYASYAQCLPADCVVTVGSSVCGDHAMMVTEPAHVEYTDGKIDPEKSYVMIQDQRAGDYNIQEDGQTVHYSGRTNYKATFQELATNHYIPCTHPVFTGAQPYTPATVTLESEGEVTLENVNAQTILTPYKIVAVNVKVLDKDGETAYSSRRVLNRDSFSKPTCNAYPCQNLTSAEVATRDLKKGETYTYQVEVLIATGQIFTPISFEFSL